jgi:pimeloyl-ACP methyl ester carboxylesterase
MSILNQHDLLGEPVKITLSRENKMATIVLVHGSTSGGWVWKEIALTLRDAGHEVYTPTLTGLGERVHLLSREIGLDTQITDIVNVLLFEDLHDVILVGHSLAGMIITGVADQVPERIAKLIYLDAVIPENGESVLDLAPPEANKVQEQRVQAKGDGWLIPVSGDSNDVTDRHRPHPWKVVTDKLILKNKTRGEIPCAYIRCSADKQPGTSWQLGTEISWRRVQAMGWSIYEVDTVHQISQDPEPKAKILLDIVNGSV